MAKKPLLALLTLALTLAAGAGAVYVLFPSDSGEAPLLEEAAEQLPPQKPAEQEAPLSASISTANLEKASLAEGVEEADPEETELQSAADLPSQLSKIKVEGMVGIAPRQEENKEALNQEEKQPLSIALKDIQDLSKAVVNLQPEDSQEGGNDSSSESLTDTPTGITMLEAPVKVRLIKNTAEYKAFKTIARGKYPEVDFNKQMLVVLESDSNLPDKVFEIQTIEEKDGKILVSYRVNIFGLEDKLNTHSVKSIDKTALPIELKQVL